MPFPKSPTNAEKSEKALAADEQYRLRRLESSQVPYIYIYIPGFGPPEPRYPNLRTRTPEPDEQYGLRRLGSSQVQPRNPIPEPLKSTPLEKAGGHWRKRNPQRRDTIPETLNPIPGIRNP